MAGADRLRDVSRMEPVHPTHSRQAGRRLPAGGLPRSLRHTRDAVPTEGLESRPESRTSMAGPPGTSQTVRRGTYLRAPVLGTRTYEVRSTRAVSWDLPPLPPT